MAEPDIWWLLPLTISLLIGAICPATGALLITQRRVLLANLMAHSVLPGLVIALAIGIEFESRRRYVPTHVVRPSKDRSAEGVSGQARRAEAVRRHDDPRLSKTVLLGFELR